MAYVMMNGVTTSYLTLDASGTSARLAGVRVIQAL